MQCPSCGNQSTDPGQRFCLICGAALSPASSPTRSHPPNTAGLPTEHQQLVELFQLDPKSNECHKCGSTAGLTRHEFGLAKITGERSVLTRIVTEDHAPAPVMLALQDRESAEGSALRTWLTRGYILRQRGKILVLRVVRGELVLCKSCLPKSFWGTVRLGDRHYGLHPLAGKAKEIGYSMYLGPSELGRLEGLSNVTA